MTDVKLKMTDRTKRAFRVVLFYLAFIIGTGVTVGILTNNFLWGLLGSVLAIVAGIVLALLIVFAYAIARAYDEAVTKKKG